MIVVPALFSLARRGRARHAIGHLLGLLALGLGPTVPSAVAGAAARDDRPAVQRFAASAAITSRDLQLDLARSSWSPAELRAALVRAYGLRTGAVSAFLSSAAGQSLLQSQVQGWSAELPAQVRLAALRAAIVSDSLDGSISLLGVLNALPVRFSLSGPAGLAAPSQGVCGCPERCGGSVLARLSFLMACLQAGATSATAAPGP